MLKTNSKKAREAMRRHVMECVMWWHEKDGDAYEGSSPVADVWEWMRTTFSWIAERGGGRNDILRYVIQGLGIGEMLSSREILAEALEETPDEAARYDNIECEELYINLFTRHFFELLEKERG